MAQAPLLTAVLPTTGAPVAPQTRTTTTNAAAARTIRKHPAHTPRRRQPRPPPHQSQQHHHRQHEHHHQEQHHEKTILCRDKTHRRRLPVCLALTIPCAAAASSPPECAKPPVGKPESQSCHNCPRERIRGLCRIWNLSRMMCSPVGGSLLSEWQPGGLTASV